AGEQVVAARGDDRAVVDGGDDDRRVNAARAALDQRPPARSVYGSDGDVVVHRVVKLNVLVAATDRRPGGHADDARRERRDARQGAGAGVAQLRDDDAVRGEG